MALQQASNSSSERREFQNSLKSSPRGSLTAPIYLFAAKIFPKNKKIFAQRLSDSPNLSLCGEDIPKKQKNLRPTALQQASNFPLRGEEPCTPCSYDRRMDLHASMHSLAGLVLIADKKPATEVTGFLLFLKMFLLQKYFLPFHIWVGFILPVKGLSCS